MPVDKDSLVGTIVSKLEKTIREVERIRAYDNPIQNVDGWYKHSYTWTYVSSNSFKVSGIDCSGTFYTGTKIRLKQGGSYKYFYVIWSAFGPDTVVTVIGGSDYTLANAAITDNYFSYSNADEFPEWFNWTPTYTGFSVNPSGGVKRFNIHGRKCTLIVHHETDGVSNQTYFTMSAPVPSADVTDEYAKVCTPFTVDSGTILTTPGLVQIPSSTNIMDLYKDLALAAWTNTGLKNADFVFTYEIATRDTEFYVDGTYGSDSNIGTYISPWKTIQHAADNTVEGDTIYIREGTYAEKANFSHGVTLTRFGSEVVTLDGTGISTGTYGLLDFRGTSSTHIQSVTVTYINVTHTGIDDNNITDGIKVMYCDEVTIDHCYTEDTNGSGIAVWRSNDITVTYNDVVDAQNTTSSALLHEECITISDCGLINNSENEIGHNTVRYVSATGNLGGIGICCKEGSNKCWVHHNLIHGMTKSGGIYIDAWNSTITNTLIEYNTVYNVLSGIGVSAERGGINQDAVIAYNIVYEHKAGAFSVYGNQWNGLKKNISFYNNTAGKCTDHGACNFMVATSNCENIIFRNCVSYTLGHNGQFRVHRQADPAEIDIANCYAFGSDFYDPDPEADDSKAYDEWKTGVTWADPKFVDWDNSDLRPYQESPMVDDGVNVGYTLDIVDTAVPYNTDPDVGCYEVDASYPNEPVPNIIFDADFEENDFLEWTSTSGTDISTDAAAALNGTNFGMKVGIDDTSNRYVTKSGLTSATGVNGVRIYFDVNSLVMANGDEFGILRVNNSGGGIIMGLTINKSATLGYQLQPVMKTDSGYDWAGGHTITDAPHFITLMLYRATDSGSSDGRLYMYIDGVLIHSTVGQDNYDTFTDLDAILLGAGILLGLDVGTAGEIFLDEVLVSDDSVVIGA